MKLNKELEIRRIIAEEVRAEIESATVRRKEILKENEEDEFTELRRAARALAWFIERVSDDSGMVKKQLPEAAYAALPETARALKEIIETIHL